MSVAETLRRQALRESTAEVVLSLVALAIWFGTRGDYGLGWDTPIEVDFGETVRQYFASGFDYRIVDAFPIPNMEFHDPAIDLLIAGWAHLIHATPESQVASISGLFWVASVWPVCRLGRHLGGAAGGWFAGIALLGMPVYRGQGFINPKDLPLACVTAWLWLAATWSAGRRWSWATAAVIGGAFAAVLLSRPGAWFFITLPLLAAVARLRGPNADSRTEVASVLLAALVLAWLLMVLPWPYAHQAPLRNPLEAMRFGARFPVLYPVMFQGSYLPSMSLPWHYLLTYLALTTPVAIGSLALLGNAVSLRGANADRGRAVAALGGGFILWGPLAAFALLRPNMYDGLRHVLFVLPPVAVFAGVGAARFAAWIPAAWGRGAVRWLVPGLLLQGALPRSLALHPYEYIYFNALGGDPTTLHERYDTEYWVTSYREAAEWLNGIQAHAEAPLRVGVVANEGSIGAMTPFLNDRTQLHLFSPLEDFSRSPWIDGMDYVVSTVRYRTWRDFPSGPEARRLERGGMLLALIRRAPDAK